MHVRVQPRGSGWDVVRSEEVDGVVVRVGPLRVRSVRPVERHQPFLDEQLLLGVLGVVDRRREALNLESHAVLRAGGRRVDAVQVVLRGF